MHTCHDTVDTLKTLLVEDEPNARLLFESLLCRWGYDVTACEDAETALEAYQQTFYPLILTDLTLPGMDGFEFCQCVRVLPKRDRSVILVITAHDASEDLQTALDSGADDYLVKPVYPEQLHVRLQILGRQFRNFAQRKQAEEDLHQLKKAVETVQVGVTMTDLSGRILYSNPAEAQIHGYQVDELIGKDLGILAPSELRETLSPEQATVMIHRVREGVNIRRDGSTFPVRLISDLVTNTEGKPAAIITICEDITERRRAEQTLRESEERFREMADTIRDGLSIIEQGNVVYVNDRVCEITGYSREELLQMSALEFAAPEEQERLQHLMEESQQQGKLPSELEFWILRKDGIRRCVRNCYTVKGGEKNCIDWYVITTDITERKLRELALEEEKAHLKKVNLVLKSTMKDRYRFGEIVGKSPAMQAVYELIANAAASDANVVIYGESGTGKELAAWTIHYLSARKEKVFVPINCGGVTESLFESEFFGHRKGAFTGAHKDKYGLFDHAHGGSLFLDEVGELSLAMQVKLLRVLADGGHTPVGDLTVRKADVRIIAATNRNPEEMVKQGTMRKDFFFRINVIPITLPLLSERREDIPLLIDHFLTQYSKGKQKPVLPGPLLERLYTYDWPGNVRELQNVLQRYLTTKRLDFHDFGEPVSDTPHPVSSSSQTISDRLMPLVRGDTSGVEFPLNGRTLGDAMHQFEKHLIAETLEQNLGHRGKTAAMLGITRRSLNRKMNKYHLTEISKVLEVS